MANLFTDKMLRHSIAKKSTKTKESYNILKEMLQPLSKAEIIEQIDIAYGCFVEECMDAKLKCPVIILIGECDKVGKVKQYCESWSKDEGYQIHIIEDAAHFSNVDNYNGVNAQISNFIKTL